jgi:hypothetical protein
VSIELRATRTRTYARILRISGWLRSHTILLGQLIAGLKECRGIAARIFSQDKGAEENSPNKIRPVQFADCTGCIIP